MLLPTVTATPLLESPSPPRVPTWGDRIPPLPLRMECITCITCPPAITPLKSGGPAIPESRPPSTRSKSLNHSPTSRQLSSRRSVFPSSVVSENVGRPRHPTIYRLKRGRGAGGVTGWLSQLERPWYQRIATIGALLEFGQPWISPEASANTRGPIWCIRFPTSES